MVWTSFAWSSCFPCEKLRRKASTPQVRRRWIISSLPLAGPSVARIFVRRIIGAESINEEGRTDSHRPSLRSAARRADRAAARPRAGGVERADGGRRLDGEGRGRAPAGYEPAPAVDASRRTPAAA